MPNTPARPRLSVPTALVTLGVLFATTIPSGARADVTLNLTPSLLPANSDPTQTVSVLFSGTISSTEANPVSLDFLSFSFSGSAGSVLSEDITPFNAVPTSITSTTPYSGPLFQINVAPGTDTGLYQGTVTLTANGGQFTPSQIFGVSVTEGAVIPEPGALTLCLPALTAAGAVVRLRRRRGALSAA